MHCMNISKTFSKLSSINKTGKVLKKYLVLVISVKSNYKGDPKYET
jgi:hypothetical protein